MKILIIAEFCEYQLSERTLALIHFSRCWACPQEIDVLFAGQGECSEAIHDLCQKKLVGKIIKASCPKLRHGIALSWVFLLKSLSANYDWIIADVTHLSQSVMPRLAAAVDKPFISDVISMPDDHTFIRSICGGYLEETLSLTDQSKGFLMTLKALLVTRTSSFLPAIMPFKTRCVEIDIKTTASGLQVISESSIDHQTNRQLPTARIVVAGGYGLGSRQNFERIIVSLADRLGAAVGATRAAIDAGFAPVTCKIGQAGYNISPDLYIAIGISGAVQHTEGILGSRVIVAINHDPLAPIFQIADYGMVGDLFILMPQFEKRLDSLCDAL